VGLQRFGVFSVIVEGMMEEKRERCAMKFESHTKRKKKTQKMGAKTKQKKKRNFFISFLADSIARANFQ
jgi:hypothetical protein